jgi:3-oxoacyl-[acyl-carrier-protein] synthase III
VSDRPAAGGEDEPPVRVSPGVLESLVVATLRAAVPNAAIDVRVDASGPGAWSVRVVVMRTRHRWSDVLAFDPEREAPLDLARAAAQLALATGWP